jgi:FtsX-like permease family
MGSSSILRLVLRRSMAGKGLLAVVALGVVVAAVLLASAPIYARAMADLGLTFTVRERISAAPSTVVQFTDVPLATAEGTSLQSSIERRIQQRLGWFESSQTQYTQLGRFGIARAGEPQRTGMTQAQPHSLPGYETHVRVVQGELPKPTGKGEPMQVAVSAEAANAAKLNVGDAFELRESFDTCERFPAPDPPPPNWPPPCDPLATTSFSYPAIVTAIIAPLDANDPFWVLPVDDYFAPFRRLLENPNVGPIVPMFTDEKSITEGFAGLYPTYRAAISWEIFADTTKLNRANFQAAFDDLRGMYADVLPLGGSSYSQLGDALEKYGKSSDQTQVPLTVLLLEISGIALFYVGLVSAIVVERQSAEIALLRSRGASMLQIATIYAWQGLLIGIPAVLAAPFLAAAATALLGVTPTFHDATGGDLLPVTIPALSFAAAAVGVVLSLLALLIPAVLVARRSAAVQRRVESRPGASIIHRYYLDLVLSAAAGLVLFELHQRGSAFEPSSTGGLSSDPLLLASPALVIAAAAALVLRLYPMALRVVARSVSAIAGVSVSLGLAQVVRNSGQYTRLTLLLMMAVAVGSFAASYASTTNRSYSDRAGYDIGADIRAFPTGQGQLPGPAPELDAKLEQIPGVAVASGVTRADMGFATPGSVNQVYRAVAIDPEAMQKILWWRDDFATKPMPELLSRLAAPLGTPGKVLAGQADVLHVWVNGDTTHSVMTLWARFRDSRGVYTTLELGPADSGGRWVERTASLSGALRGDLQAPLSLVSIMMTEPANRFSGSYTPLLVDDMTMTDKAGVTSLVDDFEGALRWRTFATRSQDQDAVATTHDGVHGGASALKFTFHNGATSETRGFFTTPQTTPLAALASDAFLKTSGMKEGSTAMMLIGGSALVPITIAGTYHLFPTIPTDKGPSIVLNRDQLTLWADTTSFSDPTDLVPAETMIGLKSGADEDAVVKALGAPELLLTRFDSRAKQLDANRRNPLIAAGGSGILLISFAAVLVLVAAALLVSLMTSLGRRRTEFAVVRSMGVSRGQLFRMLALEYSVVAVAGTAVGAFLGLIVGRQMLSFLNVTENGTKVEPGFILQTQWALVAGSVGLVFAVFAVALVLATFVMAAIADAQALRTE